jgi:hypothetical protein
MKSRGYRLSPSGLFEVSRPGIGELEPSRKWDLCRSSLPGGTSQIYLQFAQSSSSRIRSMSSQPVLRDLVSEDCGRVLSTTLEPSVSLSGRLTPRYAPDVGVSNAEPSLPLEAQAMLPAGPSRRQCTQNR